METTTTVMKRATLQEVGASTEEGSKRGRGEGGVMQVWAALHQGRRRRTYDAWSKDLDGLSVNWKHWWRWLLHTCREIVKNRQGQSVAGRGRRQHFQVIYGYFPVGPEGEILDNQSWPGRNSTVVTQAVAALWMSDMV